MANVFINGVKAKTGGGRSIFNSFLSLLRDSFTEHAFFVLTPSADEYRKYAAPHLKIVDIPDKFKENIYAPVMYGYLLPKLFRTHEIDAILNFGDIPLPTNIPQIYQFDWPHAAYPDGDVWQLLDRRDRLYSKLKHLMFKRFLHYPTVVAAQTTVMADRLQRHYALKNVAVIPNAVSLDNAARGTDRDFGLPKGGRNLLYLTHYYAHKNIEVLLEVAEELRARNLAYHLITTVGPEQDPKAAAFLEAISQRGLGDRIINIGPVPMPDLPSLWQQSDALLMPTLLESFSGAYVEAMFHRRTILTSNLDFATCVVGDAGFYFEPRDAKSIVDAIEQAFGDEPLRQAKLNAGTARLETFWDWPKVFAAFQRLIDDILEGKSAGGRAAV